MNEISRRTRVDQWSPAEVAIDAAVQAVEQAGADVRLTDACNLLWAAREAVADFVDGIDRRRMAIVFTGQATSDQLARIEALAAKWEARAKKHDDRAHYSDDPYGDLAYAQREEAKLLRSVREDLLAILQAPI